MGCRPTFYATMKQIGRSELCKSDSLAELTSTVRALRPLGRHPAGDKAFGDVAARQIKMPEPAAQFAGRIEARDWLAARTHDLLFGTIAAIQCTQTWRSNSAFGLTGTPRGFPAVCC